jgi:hypothetical protein
MDIITCFNNNKRDLFWEKKSQTKEFIGFTNKEKCKTLFGWALEHLLLQIRQTDNNVSNTWLKGNFGYDGIGTDTTGIKSGIRTSAAKNLLSKDITWDHLIGAVGIGRYVHNEFEKASISLLGKDLLTIVNEKGYLDNESTISLIEYMKEVWLYENLWLWITIGVTKEEHQKDNILRNNNTIEEKIQLKHYKNVSTLIF